MNLKKLWDDSVFSKLISSGLIRLIEWVIGLIAGTTAIVYFRQTFVDLWIIIVNNLREAIISIQFIILIVICIKFWNFKNHKAKEAVSHLKTGLCWLKKKFWENEECYCLFWFSFNKVLSTNIIDTMFSSNPHLYEIPTTRELIDHNVLSIKTNANIGKYRLVMTKEIYDFVKEKEVELEQQSKKDYELIREKMKGIEFQRLFFL